MKTFIILFFVSHFSFLIFHVGEAQVIHVPGPDSLTIQQGINAANDDDTVLVADGIYYENINFMGKAITVASHFILYGDTNLINNTIIDGSQAKDPDSAAVVMFVSGEDTNSVIRGFTITGGTGLRNENYNTQVGGGIVCISSGARIADNKITGNTVTHPSAYAGCGGIGSILVEGDSWLIVENNLIAGNHVSLSGYQAYAGGLGITCNARVTGNVIRDNTCVNNSNSYTAEASGGGFEVEQFPGTSIEVVILNNTVTNNFLQGRYIHGAGIRIKKAGIPLLTGNTIQHNTGTAVKTAYGGGLHIWEPGGDLYIADNVISENVISGEETDGGGIFIHLPYNLEFLNNTINNNKVISENYWYGAGILLNDPQGEALLINNSFSGNSGPIFSHFPVPVDYGNGGAVVIADALYNPVRIDANYFSADTAKLGGGLYFRDCFNLAITNNIFYKNHSYQGGGIFLEESGEMNAKDDHQGKDNPRPAIINNDFISNTTLWGGGGVFCGIYEPGGPVFINNIFWGNSGNYASADIYVEDASDTILVAYSVINQANIAGNWIGEGNTDEDPILDSAFHIGPGSPCLDAGADSLQYHGVWYYAPDHDFEGSWRPFGEGIDIGADEWDGDWFEEFQIPNSKFQVTCYSNPTFGIVDFRLSMVDFRMISLRIYDLQGREVATVVDGRCSGDQVVRWDATGMPAGVYFYRLTVGGQRSAVSGKILVNH